jgi:hypothetical protein
MKTSFIASIVAAVSARLTINPESRMMEDDAGRSVMLHGVNAVYKLPPYIPMTAEFDSQKSISN